MKPGFVKPKDVCNSSNFSIGCVVFVFEIQSRTGLANVFEGVRSDCLQISNYFFRVPMEILKRKCSWGNLKLLLIFERILLIMHIIMIIL